MKHFSVFVDNVDFEIKTDFIYTTPFIQNIATQSAFQK